jgi:hypothetical protein
MSSAAPAVAREISGNTRKNPNNTRVAGKITYFFFYCFEKQGLTQRRQGAKTGARISGVKGCNESVGRQGTPAPPILHFPVPKSSGYLVAQASRLCGTWAGETPALHAFHGLRVSQRIMFNCSERVYRTGWKACATA